MGTAAMLLLAALAPAAARGTRDVCYTQTLDSLAKSLFQANYNETNAWTVPSGETAEYMDSTTSLMVAMALGYLDNEKAKDEITTVVLNSAWESGLLPSQRVPEGAVTDYIDGTVYPGAGLWRTDELSPEGTRSSGFAGLPLHAFAALQVYSLGSRDEDEQNFLENIADALYAYHEFLFTKRLAPQDQFPGLVVSTHPWELPIPVESPLWEDALNETVKAMNNDRSYNPPNVPVSVSSEPNFPDSSHVYDAMLYQMNCLADKDYLDVGACPFELVSPLYNAVLLRANRALEKIVDILNDENEDTGDAGVHESKVHSWSNALADGLAALFDEDSGSYRAYIKQFNNTGQYLEVATKDFASHFGPLFGNDDSSVTDALVDEDNTVQLVENLILPTKPGSFQCGLTYPASDASCSAYTGTDKAVQWMPMLYFAQRGLDHVDDYSSANILRNVGVSFVCNTEPWGEVDTTDIASTSVNNKGDIEANFRRAVYADGDEYDDEQGATSSIAAAVAVLVVRADGEDTDNDSPPISHELTFALMVIELVIAFGIGVTCFVFSTNLIRRLQQHEKEIPFALGEHQPLFGDRGSYDEEGKDDAETAAERTAEDMGEEEQRGIQGMLKTYTPYLRLW